MNRNLKKMSFAVLAGASALALAESTKAAVTIVDVITPGNSINGGTYDLQDFYLTALTGVDTTAGTLGSGGGILGLSGTFSTTGTNNNAPVIAVPGSAATYASYIIAGGDGSLPAGYDSSLVNLDNQTAASRSGTGTTTTSKGKVTAVTGVSNSFGATWFTTDAAIVPNSDTTGAFGANLVAQIYTTPGAAVTFTGLYTTYGTNGGTITFGTPTGGPTTQNIISLTSSTAGAPTTYGSTVGSLTVTGSSAKGYPVSSEAVSPATQTGYAPVTFSVPPTSGVEVYALKLSSATADATLVADINAESATDGVTASLVAGSAYASIFPSYDILLTASAANALNASSYLAFDFSQDSHAAGITVTNVAAVPEPATLAGLAVGSVGLLLGRRKNRTVA